VDSHAFDLMLAIDRAHLAALAHAADLGIDEVPDPYYGAEDGFDRVLVLVQAGARGLLARWRAQPAVAANAQ
jgi:protein-tyrosine phosphatase